MFGSRSGWRTVASVLAGVCLGTTLAVSSGYSNELAAPPFQAVRNDDKQKNDGKNDKKNDNGDKDKNGKEKNGADNAKVHSGVPAQFADVPVLDLASCKILALTKQPAIHAANAGYQAAIARQSALNTIRVPNFLARDLPLRRTQACVGVNIAHFDIIRTQLDTQYSVTFAYLSVQYAAEQRALLESTREGTVKLREGVQAGLKAGKTFVREEDVSRVEMYLHIIDSKRVEAGQGEQRAMAALREALGVDPYCPLIVRATGQFRLTPELYREKLIQEALSRRPEIHQATLLTEVHGIEVDAQFMKRLFPTSPTFASGSDIHGRPLPAGSYDEKYSPAALGPDMPVSISGNRHSRAEVAQAYSDRSGSVLEKTKNLIALETESAYVRYVEGFRKLQYLLEAEKKAKAVFDAVDSAFQKEERRTTPQDWINANGPLTEIRSQINQMRYQILVSLAGLERATGGGYCPGLEFAPTSDANGKKDDSGKKDKDEKLNRPNGDNKNDKPEKKQDDKKNDPKVLQLPKLELGRR